MLTAMARTIAHRGPDDHGLFIGDGIGLAHRRLSIIDLAGGHQPLANEDGKVVVTFNGEIYNYAELTRRLESRGHRFATRSDTEVIVHGYEEYGDDCVLEMRGMFAFALWDERRRRLLLTRDRLGIKPLYYWSRPGLLVFGSEIKALLAHPEVKAEVDPEALELYLSLRYVPGPRTLFQGIFKLPPGHQLVADPHGFRLRRYWDLPADAEGSIPAADAVARFSELLEESVRLRLISEVPVGVFLSGGLDSTTVLAELSRVAPGRRFHAYTVGYRGESEADKAADEIGYARLAAHTFGAEHHVLRISDQTFRDALPEVIWYLDEPVADPASVPLFLISRLARDTITVVLSGEGADEILGGYGIYRRMLALERVHRLLGGARMPQAITRSMPGERLGHLASLVGLPLESRYRGVSRAFLPATRARLLGQGDVARSCRYADDLFAELYGRVAHVSPLGRMLYVDTKTWLPDDLLIKADRMTMANAQELRVPLLDHRLVELAARLPPTCKVRGRTGKALLREATAGRVPAAILERPKKGFAVPTVPLLRRLDGYTRELLLDRSAACRSWFDPKVVTRLLDEHASGAASRDQELFALLVFELWHGTFVDGRFQTPCAVPEPSEQPAPLLRAACR
jgi:asparagine synthase (glutamine-hydrolysing)